MTSPDGLPILECAVAGLPIDGETVSGDLHVVMPFEGGVLVGAVDGLGHGPQAAEAARAAVSILAAHATEPPLRLMERCHDGLRKTRGAVITLASFQRDAATMTWMGVGNVEGVLLRADTSSSSEGVALRGGIVGLRLPSLREVTVSLFAGDTLVLATDGITSGFSRGLEASMRPAPMAEAILRMHRKPADDAMVVVARYLGSSA